jgi:hypothetical protein
MPFYSWEHLLAPNLIGATHLRSLTICSMLVSTNYGFLDSFMEFISSSQDLTIRTQVHTLCEPLQVALSCMRIGLFLLNQPFQSLGQQARDRSLALDGK